MRLKGGATVRSYGSKIVGALLLMALALAVIGIGYWRRTSSVPGASPGVDQISIATNTEYVGTCPLVVAQKLRYFDQEHIIATLLPRTSGKAAMEAVVTGKADIGTVADVPVMFAGFNRYPVSVIASLFRTDRDHGIVARRDAGIAQSADLKGKRIGVTMSSTGHFTLNAILNQDLLTGSEVTMVNYKPEEMAAALRQGKIDAAATWYPFLDDIAQELGDNSLMFFGRDAYDSLYLMVGARDYVEHHPAAVRRFLRAVSRGAQYCQNHPDAIDMLDPSIIAHAAHMREHWYNYRFSVELDQGTILALEDEARWALDNHLVQRTDMPNYLAYVSLDALESINPQVVTLIH